MSSRPTIIPSLRYREAMKAVDWLVDVFGFERRLVVPGEGGGVEHAQLSFDHGGRGMIMLGSPREDQPFSPASLYVIVDDVDGHCARARAGGAEIVREPEDQDYGGRGYSCRDLEGHDWHFGSYDPWAT